MEEDKKTFNISEGVLVNVYSRLDGVPIDVILPDQCHDGNVVEIVTGNEDLDNCDGLVTESKNFLLETHCTIATKQGTPN